MSPLPLLLLQAGAPTNAWGMVRSGGILNQIVLVVLAVLSVISWIMILWKARQFGAVQRQGSRFIDEMERAKRIEEAMRALMALPDSPYGRVFRRGINFFSDLRPGVLQGQRSGEGLSLTQLEALRLVMEKEEAEERDDLSRGLPWLAIIGSIAPLLGLMGTVIGVMNTFFGIAAAGSANIAAVAPGVGGALTTTVAGLFVAIPAVVAYNHFAAKLDFFMSELEGFSSEFIGALAREGRL
ncbi:MAG: MotA/TolQ/ExbB proton channel family protein [Gemmatimonadota bacterium]